MTSLAAYEDDAVLTTSEVAHWLGVSRKAIRRLPISPLPIATKERRYRAGDVKAALAPQVRSRVVAMRRTS